MIDCNILCVHMRIYNVHAYASIFLMPPGGSPRGLPAGSCTELLFNVYVCLQ